MISFVTATLVFYNNMSFYEDIRIEPYRYMFIVAMACGASYKIVYLLYSCNMGTSGLPDMYTQNQRATGPRTEGVHIRQTTSAHVTTVMCHGNIKQLNPTIKGYNLDYN